MAITAQYRMNTVMWLIGLLIEPIIYLVVWTTIARAQGGSVQGYTASDFATYYLALLVVRQATIAPSPYRQANRIKRGEMSALLLRPIHPLHSDLADGYVQKLSSLFVLIPLVVGVGLAFGAQIHPPLWSALMFVPAVFVAGLLRFFFQYAVSCIAFWTDKLDGIWQGYVTMQTFLGGILAPLPLLPLPLRIMATILPFRWIFSFPTELVLGRLTVQTALAEFAVQIAWTLLSILLLHLLWRAGIKRYSAVGG